MNFDEYQNLTHTTAKYRDEDATFYLSLGLVSECGEIAGKLKKIIRDKNSVLSEEARKDIAAEVGDVFWYVSEICNLLEYRLSNVAKSDKMKNYEVNSGALFALNITCIELCENATALSYRLQKNYVGHANLSKKTMYSWILKVLNNLYSICAPLGISLSEVAEGNIAKLQGRKDRGVIGGSGDNR